MITTPPFKSQAELEAKHPITVVWGFGPTETGREYFDNLDQVRYFLRHESDMTDPMIEALIAQYDSEEYEQGALVVESTTNAVDHWVRLEVRR